MTLVSKRHSTEDEGDIRDCVEQMRSLSSVVIPVLQNFLETAWSICEHTLSIHLDRHNVQASWFSTLYWAHEAKLFDKYALLVANPVPVLEPFIGECQKHLVEAIRVATGQDDLSTTAVWDVGLEMIFGHLSEKVVEWRIALRSTILQSCVEINLLQWVLLFRGMWDNES